jgi:hypothetical protein
MLTYILFSCQFQEPVEPPSNPLELAYKAQQNLPQYLKPFPYTDVPEGLPDISAKTCGNCHQEIYQEWKISTHAHAYKDDLQFMAELSKQDSNDPTSDVTWMCLNCHTPLINQQEKLIVGLEKSLNHATKINNPYYNAELQEEAITCASCHVRDGIIIGPYGNPDNLAPHPVQLSTELTEASWCNQCHQAQAHFKEINLGCFFTTGEEHASSSYKAQSCQECHMPHIERPLVAGGPIRKTRYHYFGGSLIPKQHRFAEEMKQMEDLYTTGLDITLTGSSFDQKQKMWKITTSYKNSSAGHNLPSGDPERYIRIILELLDKKGNLLLQEETRIASQYQWWPEIEKISDNRLAPLEERELSISFLDKEQKGHFINIRAEHWRISLENLEYHNLEDLVPAFRIIKEEKHELIK